eukprot:TRINITY_DN1677_c0_g1_i1.p1 TRINITY_DN1677_c0_g1~~TRINITY_DN1677_c0_g1_i1.p1  ORF type:complete len:473 (-),score=149.33 TRINITY_DN1677_c0_g1_i1:70-1488(-)
MNNTYIQYDQQQYNQQYNPQQPYLNNNHSFMQYPSQQQHHQQHQQPSYPPQQSNEYPPQQQQQYDPNYAVKYQPQQYDSSLQSYNQYSQQQMSSSQQLYNSNSPVFQQQQQHSPPPQQQHPQQQQQQQNQHMSSSQQLYNSNAAITPPQQQQYLNQPIINSYSQQYNNLGFSSFYNFRDLSESTSSGSQIFLRPRMLFRSATLDNASEDEVRRLCNDININTIIDLRSETEIKSAKEEGKAFAAFPSTIVVHMKRRDLIKTELIEKHMDKAKVQQQSDHKTIMINFAGRRYRQHAVIYAAPMKVKLKLIELMTNDQKPQAVQLVGREVLAPKGLIGLYKDFIDYCYNEIGEALKYLSDSKNYPILVHCTQGKDRTGLVIALALYVCRVPEANIIYDYVLTTPGLAPVKPIMIQAMAHDGLPPSFSDSPPEIMQETFAYIKDKYGSVQNYLDRAKFTTVYREALRRILYSPSC